MDYTGFQAPLSDFASLNFQRLNINKTIAI